MLWDWDFALATFPQLAAALIVSIQITVLCSIFAAFLGVGLALLRDSQIRALRWPAHLFTSFIQGTPLLIQLYFLYFSLPEVGLSLSAWSVGILGFSIHYAAYMSDVFRAGISSVPKGQWEAADALSFGIFDKWARIVIPSMIPKILPAFGVYVILMLKETPILATITIVEVFLKSQILASEKLRYTEPLTVVGLLFLVTTISGSYLLRVWERRAAYAS